MYASAAMCKRQHSGDDWDNYSPKQISSDCPLRKRDVPVLISQPIFTILTSIKFKGVVLPELSYLLSDIRPACFINHSEPPCWHYRAFKRINQDDNKQRCARAVSNCV